MKLELNAVQFFALVEALEAGAGIYDALYSDDLSVKKDLIHSVFGPHMGVALADHTVKSAASFYRALYTDLGADLDRKDTQSIVSIPVSEEIRTWVNKCLEWRFDFVNDTVLDPVQSWKTQAYKEISLATGVKAIQWESMYKELDDSINELVALQFILAKYF